MTRAELRALLLGALASPGAEIEDGSMAAAVLSHVSEFAPAAVLVGVSSGSNPGILLTKRTETLRQHSGQVAFPGGRIDPDDHGPERAALREAHEEIGLDPTHVEVLGRLAEFRTGTGYCITPVLALLPADLRHELSPHEVSAVFEFPLSVLLDPHAPRLEWAEWHGQRHHFWTWPHDEHRIWGATASILHGLARRLRKEGQGALPPGPPLRGIPLRTRI